MHLVVSLPKLIAYCPVKDYLKLFPNLVIHPWTWNSVIEGMTVLSKS